MSHVVFEREPGARGDAPTFTMPRPIGRTMVALALLTIMVAASARAFGFHAPVQPLAAPVAQRELVLRDRSDGGVDVLDQGGHRVLAVLANADSARFLRTVVRGLGVRSEQRNASLDVAFTLTMRADGQLTVAREGSPRVTSINGFGLSQVASLQRLLVAR